MKLSIITSIFWVLSMSAFSQRTTFNNFTGDWNPASSWTDGVATTNDEDDDFIINGYITNTAALLRISGDVTINDTLVVEGNLDLDQNNSTLTLGSGAILIVLGDFDFANKLNIDNDGVIAVSGTFNKDGSITQGSFTGSGNVYATSYGPVGGGGGGGTTADWVDSGYPPGEDHSKTVTELTGDGQGDIEDFINSGGGTPLPVELLYFEVTNTSYVQLKWGTATEINNDYFQIERSEDGVHFYEIARIAGNGTSSEEIHYSYEDNTARASVEYYRLKQVDFDGQFEYFETKMIEIASGNTASDLKTYPTMIQNQVVHISSSHAFQIKDAVAVDLKGSDTKNLMSVISKQNFQTYDVDLSQFRTGVYLLTITTTAGVQCTSRFVIR